MPCNAINIIAVAIVLIADWQLISGIPDDNFKITRNLSHCPLFVG